MKSGTIGVMSKSCQPWLVYLDSSVIKAGRSKQSPPTVDLKAEDSRANHVVIVSQHRVVPRELIEISSITIASKSNALDSKYSHR